MLFHFISLVVLVPLMKSPRVGFAVNTVVILLFTLSTAILSAINDYPPAVVPTAAQIE